MRVIYFPSLPRGGGTRPDEPLRTLAGWLVGWVSGLGRRRVENFEEIGAAVYKSAFIGRGEARNTELP